MGNRDWGREFESLFQHGPQRGRGDWSRGPGGPGGHGGSWGTWGGWGPAGRRQGPPPWLAGLFGLASPEPGRGPRVRRGDVRVAILAVLADGPLNGYQVIQQISDRTDGAWRPSPGSVYPTISQLEDEGLVEGDDERGRRSLTLSEAGRTYLAEHADEIEAVWAPFSRARHERPSRDDEHGDSGPDFAALKPELGRVMNAVWQIITTGTDEQRRAAVGVLVEARRGLYRILADDAEADGEVDDLDDGTPRPEHEEES
ncbi:MAG TPA: PadR family transcriptional regulator [Nocardioides sp.]|jgi:DNA-binding PadR family transcriptional regulator|nr:PadR family transcriptional regulator [Nocardioides sp.]